MPFCTNCGSKIPDGSVFCANCGARQEAQRQAPAQQPAQPQQMQYQQPMQPQQKQYQQPTYQQAPYQQPAYQQAPPYYGYAPAKKKSSAGVFVGIAAAVIVIAAVVVGIILFSGGGGLKDFDYEDIVGNYSGTATPGSYKLSGDWQEYADSQGEDLDTVNEMVDGYNEDYKDEKIDIEVTLSEDTLYFYCPDYYVFFGDDSLSIEDFEIGENGVAKGTFEDTYYGADIMIKYKVTLKADGDGYRLVGEVTYTSGMSFDYDEKSYEVSYSSSFDFDVTTGESGE